METLFYKHFLINTYVNSLLNFKKLLYSLRERKRKRERESNNKGFFLNGEKTDVQKFFKRELKEIYFEGKKEIPVQIFFFSIVIFN